MYPYNGQQSLPQSIPTGMEEVFAQYEDTAGNYHWHGTNTGEHIIRKQDTLYNFIVPEACKYYGYYYNFRCRAEQCIENGAIT